MKPHQTYDATNQHHTNDSPSNTPSHISQLHHQTSNISMQDTRNKMRYGQPRRLGGKLNSLTGSSPGGGMHHHNSGDSVKSFTPKLLVEDSIPVNHNNNYVRRISPVPESIMGSGVPSSFGNLKVLTTFDSENSNNNQTPTPAIPTPEPFQQKKNNRKKER